MNYRILTGQISHETNTFNKISTTLEHFQILLGEEIPPARRGTRSALGAAFETADKFGWTLSHPLVASANPSGTVTKETFEQLGAWFLAGAEGCDGALIELHGAMAAEGCEDADGEILARLRAILGPDAPIQISAYRKTGQAKSVRANESIRAARCFPMHVVRSAGLP